MKLILQNSPAYCWAACIQMALDDAGYQVPTQDHMASTAQGIDSTGNYQGYPEHMGAVLSSVTGKTITGHVECDLSKLPALLDSGRYIFVFAADLKIKAENPGQNLGNHVVMLARQPSGDLEILDPASPCPLQWNGQWREQKQLFPFVASLPPP